MARGVGNSFQQETKYERGELGGGRPDSDREPEPFKDYPDVPRIALDPPQLENGPPLWEILHQRRSVREFVPGKIRKADLSQLLWAAQGITADLYGHALRAAPSAGALYPIETYLAVHDVETIAPGVYHYDARAHALDQLKTGDIRLAVARAALDQDAVYEASLVVIWTAVFQRSKWKYGQRAYRYIYLDAGHIAQNVALAAVGLGLGSCQIAALYDDEVNAILGLDGKTESAIYMTVVGKPKN